MEGTALKKEGDDEKETNGRADFLRHALRWVHHGGAIPAFAANSGGEEQGAHYVGTAPDYHVIIDEGLNSEVYGKKADTGEASGGTVIFKNGTVTGNIYGVGGKNGAVEGGVVEISGGIMEGETKGGYSENGSANNNKVTVNAGMIKDDIIGGSSFYNGSVQGNSVFIKGGEFSAKANNTLSIYGGLTNHGNAIENEVIISGGVFDNTVSIYGGYVNGLSPSEGANRNSVMISGVTISNGYIYGGIAWSGGANNNSITISGGAAKGWVYSGASSTGNASYNTLTINNGTVTGELIGGYAPSGDSTDNYIEMNDGEVEGELYGGVSKNGDVANNSISFNGGTVTGLLYGGSADSGSVSNNRVVISGGTVNGDVYGGYTGGGTVKKNSIIISSGKVAGTVFGGYTEDTGDVSQNTITVTGTADLANADLYGNSEVATGTNGNRLIVDGWSGTVRNLGHFDAVDLQNLTFTPGATVVDVTGQADLTNTAVNVSFAGGQHFAVGDQMTLISNVTNGPASETVYIPAGVGQVVGAVLAQDGTAALTVNRIRLNAQTVLVGKSRAVSAAFVNQGSDLVSDGLDALGRDGQYGLKTFAAMYGGRHTYDAGSDLKINGWSTIAGLGGEHRVHGGDFLWGVFYENGTGNYRAWNEANGERFRGDGDLLYNGGGAAVRWEQDSGFYVEGSVRAGTLKSDLSNALRDSAGRSYGYSSRSSYFGLHVGAGRRLDLGGDRELDLYGKYFHTYTEGDGFTVDNDRFTFDGVKSDRLRLGARMTHNAHGAVSAYYGLAWEYEFSGDAHMTVQGQRAPEESFGGGSAMAEAGLRWTPGGHSPWSFDVGLRGYAGEREGLSGSILAAYTF